MEMFEIKALVVMVLLLAIVANLPKATYTLEIQIFDHPQRQEIETYYRHYQSKYDGDACVDMLITNTTRVSPVFPVMLECSIAAAMFDFWGQPVSYWLMPRSSSNVGMLVVSPGVIDAGYRGSLNLPVRSINHDAFIEVKQFSRLAQICAPHLNPIHVKVVAKLTLYPASKPERDRSNKGLGSSGV